jgi:hypothetical protein
MYLSYPALYTHIKQKHLGVTPSGTNTSQHFTGRGRGRPRKTNADIDKNNKRIDIDGAIEDYGNEDGIAMGGMLGLGASEQ